MNKYIDSEKLKRLIESIGLIPQKQPDYNDGRENMKNMVLDLIDSLQHEEPERICLSCVHYNKTDDMCQCPHGGRDSYINGNGVYKCNMFEEVELEQPEVDLDYLKNKAELIANEIMMGVQANKYHTCIYNKASNDFNHSHLVRAALKGIKFGLNARKEDK